MRRSKHPVYVVVTFSLLALITQACSESGGKNDDEKPKIEKPALSEDLDAVEAQLPKDPDWEFKVALLDRASGPLSKLIAFRVYDLKGEPIELSQASVVIVPPRELRAEGYGGMNVKLNQLEPGYRVETVEFPAAGDYHFKFMAFKHYDGGKLDSLIRDYVLTVEENAEN